MARHGTSAHEPASWPQQQRGGPGATNGASGHQPSSLPREAEDSLCGPEQHSSCPPKSDGPSHQISSDQGRRPIVQTDDEEDVEDKEELCFLEEGSASNCGAIYIPGKIRFMWFMCLFFLFLFFLFVRTYEMIYLF